MQNSTGLARSVALARALHFGANAETLASNVFQASVTEPDAQARALHEQECLATALADAGIEVLWLDPPSNSRSPDTVFPNNWFSTHEDGRLVYYPMEAVSRRSERIPHLDEVLREAGFQVTGVLDISAHEGKNVFLEGTGSLVLDRINRIAYLCPSTRSNVELAETWAGHFNYRLQLFHATDPSSRAVYHTNVIMSVGAGLAIICLDAIRDDVERAAARTCLENSGQRVVEISWEQVRRFAGNQLFLQGREGPVLALSESANRSLSREQCAVIDRHAERVAVDIATIERHGGGSVRCMLAEVFLPRAPENK